MSHPTLLAEDFPLLLATTRHDKPEIQARREHAFREALHVLSQAAAGIAPLRKVVFDEIKYVLGRAADEAWQKNVSDKFVNAGAYKNLPKEVNELTWEINHSNLHDFLSTQKKLDKTRIDHPCITAMKAVSAETHQLSTLTAGLKASLVKGRATPTEEEKQALIAKENPDKIIKTCACCFRPIALAGQTMAHHGYERPGHGTQTSSCGGIRFKPLEVSSEGLQWVLEVEKRHLARAQNAYDKRDALKSLTESIDRKTKQPVLVEIGDPKWPRLFRAYEANLESEIRFGTRAVEELQSKLDAWVQTEPDGLSSVKKPRARKSP